MLSPSNRKFHTAERSGGIIGYLVVGYLKRLQNAETKCIRSLIFAYSSALSAWAPGAVYTAAAYNQP